MVCIFCVVSNDGDVIFLCGWCYSLQKRKQGSAVGWERCRGGVAKWGDPPPIHTKEHRCDNTNAEGQGYTYIYVVYLCRYLYVMWYDITYVYIYHIVCSITVFVFGDKNVIFMFGVVPFLISRKQKGGFTIGPHQLLKQSVSQSIDTKIRATLYQRDRLLIDRPLPIAYLPCVHCLLLFLQLCTKAPLYSRPAGAVPCSSAIVQHLQKKTNAIMKARLISQVRARHTIAI